MQSSSAAPAAASSDAAPLPTAAEEDAVATMFHQLLQHLPDEFKWALLAEAVQSVDTSALQHLSRARDSIIYHCSRLDGNILRGISQYVDDAEAAASADSAEMDAAAAEVADAMRMNDEEEGGAQPRLSGKRRREERASGEMHSAAAVEVEGETVPPGMAVWPPVQSDDVEADADDGDDDDDIVDDPALMDAIRRSYAYNYAFGGNAQAAKEFFTAHADEHADIANGPTAWPAERLTQQHGMAGVEDDDVQSQADEM